MAGRAASGVVWVFGMEYPRAHTSARLVTDRGMKPGTPAAPRVISLAVLPFGPGAVRKPCRAGPSLIHLAITRVV